MLGLNLQPVMSGATYRPSSQERENPCPLAFYFYRSPPLPMEVFAVKMAMEPQPDAGFLGGGLVIILGFPNLAHRRVEGPDVQPSFQAGRLVMDQLVEVIWLR